MNKSHLILIGIGLFAGYFTAQSLINQDFNGSRDGTMNPFSKAYAFGFEKSSGIKVA